MSYKDIKLCDLKRKSTPMTNNVVIDDYVKSVLNISDDSQLFYPFEFPEELKNLDFRMLVITGKSGSGKSTLSKYFGTEEVTTWDNSKAIISNFDDSDEAVKKLGAVGLNSIPTWCKPRRVLSVGEGFRADLARKLHSNCIIDEFTSTVDRTVAMSCAKSVGKYIKNNNLTHCVFVSCHKDFIDCMCPDYVIDLDDECIYDTRNLECRKFNLQIYDVTDNKLEVWKHFKAHHYLSAHLNKSCRLFAAYFGDELVSCCAILPQPGVHNSKYSPYRVHRLVVIPDYQGLGVATRFMEYICDLYIYHERIIYLRTSHSKLIQYMLHSNSWKGDGRLEASHPQSGILSQCWLVKNEDRLSTSFKYVAPCKYIEGRRYDWLSFKERTVEDISSNELF